MSRIADVSFDGIKKNKLNVIDVYMPKLFHYCLKYDTILTNIVRI